MKKNGAINILGIAPYRFLPAINGGHKAIEQLYQNIGEYVKTTVVSTKSNSKEVTMHFQIIKLFDNSVFRYINLLYYFTLKNIIRRQQITHVILEHPYMGWLGIMLQKHTNIRLVIHSHNIEAERFKTVQKWWWKLLWYYEKWVYNRADKVCFITDADKAYAIQYYHLPERKCIITTFGTELNRPPFFTAKQKAKVAIQQLHATPPLHKIILFTGSFSYGPNLDALNQLLYTIHPLLSKKRTVDYTILVCGINIPEPILNTPIKGVVIAGFVENITTYLLSADVFVCPITAGGGIKTKLIEALAYDNTCVSYNSSATGIDETVCNGKLLIAADNNVEQFVQLTEEALISDKHITDTFYKQYSAQHIARHLLECLQNSLP